MGNPVQQKTEHELLSERDHKIMKHRYFEIEFYKPEPWENTFYRIAFGTMLLALIVRTVIYLFFHV